ncbi:MAG: DMT family transporter [Candidatus Caldarchaeum sp.]|nr:DMT family transporter [Candidatus Caldarchaeum sp.]
MIEHYLGISAALGAALFFSLSRILVRLGLRDGYVNQAHYTSVLLNNVCLWPVAAIYTYIYGQTPSLISLAVFLAAGIFATGLGRLLTFTTLKTMTATESTPFVSVSPLFATLIAILLLGETATPRIIVGTVLVVGGLLAVSNLKEHVFRLSILTGLTASFFYSLGEALRKYGTTLTPNPPAGAAIGSLAALAFLPFYRNHASNQITRNKFFFMSGISTSAALLLVFVAYALTPLVIAVPLINTSPLFTIVLSLLIARKTENFKLQVIAGCLTVMLGILLIVV